MLINHKHYFNNVMLYKYSENYCFHPQENGKIHSQEVRNRPITYILEIQKQNKITVKYGNDYSKQHKNFTEKKKFHLLPYEICRTNKMCKICPQQTHPCQI